MSDEVEILSLSRDTQTIHIRRRPQSSRHLVSALLEYWKIHEMPYSITEVLRYSAPQKIFYNVLWTEEDDDDN